MARRVESDEFSGPRSYIDVKIKWVSQICLSLDRRTEGQVKTDILTHVADRTCLVSGVRRVERSLLQQGIIRLQPLDKTETQGIRDVRLSMHCLMLTRLIFLISSTTAPSKIQLEENF